MRPLRLCNNGWSGYVKMWPFCMHSAGKTKVIISSPNHRICEFHHSFIGSDHHGITSLLFIFVSLTGLYLSLTFYQFLYLSLTFYQFRFLSCVFSSGADFLSESKLLYLLTPLMSVLHFVFTFHISIVGIVGERGPWNNSVTRYFVTGGGYFGKHTTISSECKTPENVKL